MNQSRFVTIKDVAKEAGVSIGAVSKVLHGRGGNIRVSEATAQRIRDAARTLNYRPNYHARSLRSGRSRSVGVVATSAHAVGDRGMYGAYLLDRLTTVLHAKGYSLNMAPELMPLPDLQGLSDGRFDGLVWLNMVPHGPLVEAFYGSPVPVVAIGGIYGETPERGALFLIDEEESYRVILDHLAGLGHQNLLYSDRAIDRYDALGEARAEGLAAAAKERGLTITIRASANAEEAFAVWNALSPRPTAIVAYSDHRGAMLMQRARDHGVDVPGEVSILTFDGSPFSLWGWPGLTTIRPPVDNLADHAIEHLIQQMERLPVEPILETLRVTLDEAGSTGPAPK